MYLLNTKTAELHYFISSSEVRYAILSHVWQDVRNELSFRDVKNVSAECALSGEIPRSRVSAKIRNCCIFAQRAGYEWVWIDTCCIDHHSSAELSEAINSMYAWYADADVCYAYLYDVGDDGDPSAPHSSFRRSRWFERGWTLQELIAPARVVFLSQTWCTLGSKYMLATVVEQITAIQKEILTGERPLDSVSVAQRMSWAAKRKTTRVEDRAYSLLGIFGISMPTIYGEGPRAFVRLQEEILRRIPDQSIFAWGRLHADVDAARKRMESEDVDPTQRARSGDQSGVAFDVQAKMQDMLAPSPSEFIDSAGYKPINISDISAALGLPLRMPHYALTSHGIRTQLPLSEHVIESWRSWMARTASATTQHVQLALLACENAQGQYVLLFLRRAKYSGSLQYAVGEFIDGTAEEHYYRGAFLPRELLVRIEAPPLVKGPDVAEVNMNPLRLQSHSHREHRTFQYGNFELHEPYIYHQSSAPSTLHVHPDGPIGEAMAPVPTFTFFLPHWLFAELESKYGLVCESSNVEEDGLTLTVPCHLTLEQIRDSVFARVSFLDDTRRERLTVRVGAGKCPCLPTQYTGAHGAPLHKLWVDVSVSPVDPSSSDSSTPAEHALPWKPASGQTKPYSRCSLAHIDGTRQHGDHSVIQRAFADERRRVEVTFAKREGFEVIRRIPCKTWTIVLTLSGSVYQPAPAGTTAVSSTQVSEVQDDTLGNAPVHRRRAVTFQDSPQNPASTSGLSVKASLLTRTSTTRGKRRINQITPYLAANDVKTVLTGDGGRINRSLSFCSPLILASGFLSTSNT
ncbi:heterokaryon incompatibility protein-domain-containing protein [Cubamyces lactineus]|nr:heterokaryon incompatibility protein-domain-containing protein [Cubamyces lactineus]